MTPAPDDRRLVDQAHRLRAEAHRLLHEDGLLALVGDVGPAAVVGSAALDLMTWPDLDVNVRLPHAQDVAAFLGLGTRIATGFRVKNLTFWNQFVSQPAGRDTRALYAGCLLLVGDREWKLDLWGFGAPAFRARMQAFEALRRRLAGADRLAILRVKDAVCRRPEYGSGVSSLDVYEAVAGGVRSVAQFDDWLRTRRAAP